MKFNKLIPFIFLLSLVYTTHAQEDLFKELDSVKSTKKEIEVAAFKAMQIANMQSTKLAAKGEYYFIISHRFGDLNNGLDNFFGLDNAFTKIGGVYGATNWLSLGLSRHTYNKTYEIAVKYKLANQEIEGFPVTIVGYNTIDINSALSTDVYPNLEFNNRISYATELLISRKFSNSFSLQLTPVFIHKNLYDDLLDQKNLFLLAAGSRYKITKRMSLNLEYGARLNVVNKNTSPYYNPVTVGLDIETGGHVFQLLFSNSQTMNDVAFYSNSNGSWFSKGIYFGFNLYRVF